jgi:transposase
MNFEKLTDDQWSFIRPHLPPQPKVGRKRADDRKTINAILYVLITGCRWREIPKDYGSYVTAWKRLKRWSSEGIWTNILIEIRNNAYHLGELSLDIVSVDSSLVDSKKEESLLSITATRKERE